MSTDHVKMNIAAAADQEELVRMLAMLRLRSDLEASARGITEHSVLGFSEKKLEALPETMIVHILSDYFIMRKNGAKDGDIFKRLDVQRSLAGHTKTTLKNPTLNTYIKQRLHIEFPQLSSLKEKIIDMETLYAVYWFTKESRGPKDWQKANTFANQVIASIHEEHKIDKIEDKIIENTNETIAKNKSGWFILIFFLLLLCALGYWAYFMNGFNSFK